MGRWAGYWIWILTASLVTLWFVGLVLNVGGEIIHLLLVAAIVLLTYEIPGG